MVQQHATWCSGCGVPQREQDTFCRECGTPAPAAAAAMPAQEPVCWYCGRRPAERASAAEVELYADAKRSFAGVTAGGYRTRVEWRSRTVVAPRCTVCMGGHKAAHRWERAGLWLGVLLASPLFLLPFAVTGGSGLGMVIGMIAGVPGSFFWGWLGGRWIGQRRAARAGTRPFKAGSRAHPQVAEQLAQGWQLGKPRGVR